MDKYTVVFYLKKPNPVFWYLLTDSANAYMPIICKKYISTVGDDEAMKNPIGSGPYFLVEHEMGDYLKFQALEKHWRLVPEFKYLIARIVREPTTLVAMLKTGEIDMEYLEGLSYEAIPQMVRLSGDEDVGEEVITYLEVKAAELEEEHHWQSYNYSRARASSIIYNYIK